MRRQPFTLIEMLVVIMLAVMLMGMGATAFNNLGNSQRLSIGSGAVYAALQQARAHALKTKKVTAVYFLDGGDYPNTETTFTTYDTTAKEMTPCELVIFSDNEEVNRIKLPEGVAWYDANSLPSDATNSSRPYYHRACSLIVYFTPAGSAWPEILSGNGGSFRANEDGVRTVASCTNIRVFNVDQLPDPKYSETNNGGANALFSNNGGNKKPDDIFANAKMRNFTWTTIHINYLTGIAETIHGPKETWTKQ